MEVELPRDLEKEYYKIRSKFNSISGDWKKYASEIIPEDKEFAEEIIAFLIKIIGYIEKNFKNLDLIKWNNFLYFYEYDFYYGSDGDNQNYLDFDEGHVMNPVWEAGLESNKSLNKKQLKLLKTKLIKLKNKFE